MNPSIIIGVLLAYFFLLILISYLTSKGADDNASFFVGGNKSPWYVVAFGMIGASLSGVTFISVPGWVADSQFAYMQVVLGYLVGYFVIANVLMPMYYRLKLTSIYTYLNDRLGLYSYKTGALFFLLSRSLGSAFRLFLVAKVLQIAVFDELGVPFFATVSITILLIWLYTFKGGIKTIVWTDTLQTFFMLAAVGTTIVVISNDLNLSFSELFSLVDKSEYSQIFFFDDFNSGKHFIKQFIGGMFIAIAMTGLDQDMMQKNLSCKNIGDAKKNMYSFSVVLIFVNFFFLFLGALLYIYSKSLQIEIPDGDSLYPILATKGHLGIVCGILFIVGLVAAAYSSADSALTALTTSVCVDFLGIDKRDAKTQTSLRKKVHLLVSLGLLIIILVFNAVSEQNVIKTVLDVASFTYGPLLGLYAFGLFTKLKVKDMYVPIVCVLAPAICIALKFYSEDLFDGYVLSFEILPLNGLLTFFGLLLIKETKIN